MTPLKTSPTTPATGSNPPYRKILVLRYRFIGDTLLTVPFLRNLRAAFPDAQIDMLVAPVSGDVLRHCPYIDNLIYFDTTRKHRYEQHGGEPMQSFWSYVARLRREKYDVAYVLKRSLSSAFLAFLAGIPRRIGFATEGRSLLLTRGVPYDKTKPEAECFLDVLRADGVAVQDTHLESWWSPEHEAMAEAIYEPYRNRRNVLIHMTSSNEAKEWPLEHWTRLAQWLAQEHEVTLHCLGASNDLHHYEALRQTLPQEVRSCLQNWCGHTTLLESLAFLKRMDFVVGVDSGTLHMAAAAGTPVVALFGPMNEVKWGPHGPQHQVVTEPMACRPCNLKVECSHQLRCMTELSVEKVQTACAKLLNS